MRMILALLIACASIGVAHAADKPLIAPAPAWVKPVPLPDAKGKPDEAAIRLLLQDQQSLLEAGRQTSYAEFAIRIQTPQGLTAGNIVLPWRPDMDVLTVHKVHILRGSEVIDVLESGQTFTVVRRESNLESATLDGVLTATMQPEGLQVGDVINVAVSVASSDPTLKEHVELVGAGWNGLPVERAHLRVQWPSSLPIRMRQPEGLPPLKLAKGGGTTSIELSIDKLEPIQPPKGAPPRFQIMRLVELSDFDSWAPIGTLMAPLYEKAAVLPPEGPLQAELARIKALSPDKKVRAEAALALVQDRIRYVLLAMGDGGLVPADAQTTWSRRFGDCKGKTALLLALLHALEIDAEPVAVNTILGDGLNERLPMVGLFNHVLVRATIDGRAYWLDGTRTGDKSLDAIPVPAFGWGLPLIEKGAALVRMMPPPLEQPSSETIIRMDATAGLTIPAPTKIEAVTRGDEAVELHTNLSNLTQDARDRALRDYWKSRYDFIDVKSTTTSFDPVSKEQRLTMEGLARMDWSGGSYETDGTSVGYEADFSRDPGPNRDAPFAVYYPYYSRTIQTILLPAGFRGGKAEEGAKVDQTVAGIEYRRHSSLSGNVFTIEKTERSIVPEFPARDAPAAQAALRELFDKTVYLRKPKDYRPTEQEIAAKLADTPEDANAFIDRGLILMKAQRYDEAIADFGRAAALDPKSAWALANRGLSYAWKGDAVSAARDLDAAHALDARNPVVFRARGLLAQQKGDLVAAASAYTTSLEIDPGNDFALGRRAEVYRALGEKERALADAAAAIKLNPRMVDAYLLRVNLLRSQGKDQEALAETAALLSANPDEVYAHVAAARVYAAYKRTAETMQAFDRAIAIKPESYIYINRSQVRPKDDFTARRADIEEALRLDPESTTALVFKAELQQELKDHRGAVVTLSKAIEISNEDLELLALRGIAHTRSGNSTLAAKDFAAARAEATEAVHFNNLCWAKATADVALESALEECNTALAKQPDAPGYLDSRALVLLRLGRIDDAIADYDRALAKSPTMSSSLFGRALARAAKKDKAGSETDRAAAVKVNPNVEAEFAGYGLAL